jgi:hypothetical protein
MNLIRWILGFPLATVISLGTLVLSITYGNIGALHIYAFAFIYRIAIIMFSFAIWVFLTCLFIPSYKKYAGFLPAILSLALAGLSIYVSFTDKYSGGRIPEQLLITLSFMVVGLCIGYFVSYQLFKDKGWGRLTKPPVNLPQNI